MKNRFIVYLLLYLFFFAAASQAQPSVLEGQYRCTGHDFLNKTTFDEPTTLTKKGDTYSFVWKNNNIVFYGTAILQANTLSSVFWTLSNMSTPGVVTYQVLPNGDLKGKWTIKESRQVGDEYCYRVTKPAS